MNSLRNIYYGYIKETSFIHNHNCNFSNSKASACKILFLRLHKHENRFASEWFDYSKSRRAYNFLGSFSYAYLDLLKKGAQDIDFIEIRDLKTNQPLQFSVEEDSSHVKATWYYSAMK
jgi:hypothetical protein